MAVESITGIYSSYKVNFIYMYVIKRYMYRVGIIGKIVILYFPTFLFFLLYNKLKRTMG